MPARKNDGLCRWGGPRCREERAEGSKFCAEHRDVLAGFRDDIAKETEQRRRAGTSPGRRTILPRCGVSDCGEPRPAAAKFCRHHERIIG